MKQTIKFIAADMDGTLLNDQKLLPSNFYQIFEQLYKHNILFAAASGRQYKSLVEVFEPIKEKMIFIAENGTLVMHQGKELYSATLATADVHKIIDKTRSIEGAFIVLCGKHSAYIETEDTQVLVEVRKYYASLEIVADLKAVAGEFIKIAVLNFDGTEKQVYPIVAPLFAETHQVVVSADIWLDIMNKSASKGMAIKQLQETFNFTFKQSMSFGDYLNDVEMLEETYFSYAMENAHPKIKRLARFIAPSNNHDGVTQVIQEKLLSDVL